MPYPSCRIVVPCCTDRDELRFAASDVVYRVARRGVATPSSSAGNAAAALPTPAPAAQAPTPSQAPAATPAVTSASALTTATAATAPPAPPKPAPLTDDGDDDSGSDFEADDGATGDAPGAVVAPQLPKAFGKAVVAGPKAIVLHAAYSRSNLGGAQLAAVVGSVLVVTCRVMSLPCNECARPHLFAVVSPEPQSGQASETGVAGSSGGAGGVSGGGKKRGRSSSGDGSDSDGGGPAGAGAGTGAGAPSAAADGSGGDDDDSSDDDVGPSAPSKPSLATISKELELPITHEVALRGHNKVCLLCGYVCPSVCLCGCGVMVGRRVCGFRVVIFTGVDFVVVRP